MLSNEIYEKQAGSLMLITALCFKLGGLPALLANVSGNPLPVLLIFGLVEAVLYVLMYIFLNNGGLNPLLHTKTPVMNILMAIMLVYCFVKASIFLLMTVSYVNEFLFERMPEIFIFVTLLLPIAYMAVKGIKSMARLSVLFVIIFLVVIAVNFLLVKASMDFKNNFPFIGASFSTVLKSGGSYGAWFMDATPFIFISLRKEKKPFYLVSTLITFLTLIAYYVFANAIFGGYVFGISNLFIKLSSFNYLSFEIGRLDWLGSIVWMLVSVLNVAFMYWGAIEAADIITKKRNISAGVIFVGALAVLLIFYPLDYRIFAAMPWIGYVMLGVGFLVPATLCIWLLVKKKKEKDAEAAKGKIADAAEENTGGGKA